MFNVYYDVTIDLKNLISIWRTNSLLNGWINFIIFAIRYINRLFNLKILTVRLLNPI